MPSTQKPNLGRREEGAGYDDSHGPYPSPKEVLQTYTAPTHEGLGHGSRVSQMSVLTHTHMYIYIYTYIHTYIHIEREREREQLPTRLSRSTSLVLSRRALPLIRIRTADRFVRSSEKLQGSQSRDSKPYSHLICTEFIEFLQNFQTAWQVLLVLLTHAQRLRTPWTRVESVSSLRTSSSRTRSNACGASMGNRVSEHVTWLIACGHPFGDPSTIRPKT